MYIPTSEGRWVDENFERIGTLINEYDHNLELRWIPPEKRTRDDGAPYVVVDTRTNHPILFAFEDSNPQEILAKVYTADCAKHDVLSRLEKEEQAARALQNLEWEDRLAEVQDEAAFMIGSPLNWLRMRGKKFDDQRRVIG